MNFASGVLNMAQVPANKGDNLFMRLHSGRTPLALGGGEMMRAMTHYVHGNAGGRAIAVSPPGTPKAAPCPIPLRESQRDSAIKPGVAPPRRYPG